MTYFNTKRIKQRVHCGEVNLPYGTFFDVDEQGFIYTVKDDKRLQICWETSEFAYKNFAWDADGNGKERYQIINECINLMAHIDKDSEFIKLFDDMVAMKYKKHPDDDTEWSWDRLKVHQAPIEDLRYLKRIFERMKKIDPIRFYG